MEKFLSKYRIKYLKSYNTARLSYIKAGGEAEFIAFPDDEEKLINLIKECFLRDKRFFVLGNCSNTAIGNFEGILICTKMLNSISAARGELVLGAGYSPFSRLKMLDSYGFFYPAELSAIPGSIGGLARNNAGAHEKTISDIFLAAKIYDPKNEEILTVDGCDMGFSYRKCSMLTDGKILLSATLKAEVGRSIDSLHEARALLLEQRRKKQPKIPSLGSFFKRINGVSAAELIDKAGMKGAFIGDAQVCEMHAGFIVNNGNAKIEEIDLLAKACERKVYKKFSVILEREAELIF